MDVEIDGDDGGCPSSSSVGDDIIVNVEGQNYRRSLVNIKPQNTKNTINKSLAVGELTNASGRNSYNYMEENITENITVQEPIENFHDLPNTQDVTCPRKSNTQKKSNTPTKSPVPENENSTGDEHYSRSGRVIKVPSRFKDYILTKSE